MPDFKKFDPLEWLVLPIIADLFGAARRRCGDYSAVVLKTDLRPTSVAPDISTTATDIL
jgi:hypothetical protein